VPLGSKAELDPRGQGASAAFIKGPSGAQELRFGPY
jgi:hypothetical protein